MIDNKILNPFAITGYSGGAGKTYLLRKILYLSPDHCFSISHATRDPREGETDGVDYHFIDQPTFDRMIENGEFLEWNKVKDKSGKERWYGSSIAEYERIKSLGKTIAFDVDYKGIIQLREKLGEELFVIALLPDAATRLRWMNSRTDMSEEKNPSEYFIRKQWSGHSLRILEMHISSII